MATLVLLLGSAGLPCLERLSQPSESFLSSKGFYRLHRFSTCLRFGITWQLELCLPHSQKLIWLVWCGTVEWGQIFKSFPGGSNIIQGWVWSTDLDQPSNWLFLWPVAYQQRHQLGVLECRLPGPSSGDLCRHQGLRVRQCPPTAQGWRGAAQRKKEWKDVLDRWIKMQRLQERE